MKKNLVAVRNFRCDDVVCTQGEIISDKKIAALEKHGKHLEAEGLVAWEKPEESDDSKSDQTGTQTPEKKKAPAAKPEKDEKEK